MSIRYRCHACGQLLSIASRMSGRTFPCPSCQAATVVPAADDPAEAGRPLLPPMPKAWDEFHPQPGDTTVRPAPPLEAENRAVAHGPDMQIRPENTLDLAPACDAADETGQTLEEPRDVDDEAAVATHAIEAAAAIAARPRMVVSHAGRFSTFGLPSLLFGGCMAIAIFSWWHGRSDSPSRPVRSAARPAENLEKHPILVRVDDKGNIFVDDKQVPDDSQLGARLLKSTAASARGEMVLDVDSAAPQAKVDWLVKTARGAGIQQIRTPRRDPVR